jgi:hypothetical protein
MLGTSRKASVGNDDRVFISIIGYFELNNATGGCVVWPRFELEAVVVVA